jgi:hypothetical protein
MGIIDEDIEFLKRIAKINEEYPNTNSWREVVPLKPVLAILEKFNANSF